MPTELLLPAFALTLLANAALVAVAVRWLIRARAERDRVDQSDRPTDSRTIVARPEAAAEPHFAPPPAPTLEPEAPAAPPPEPIATAAPLPSERPTATPPPISAPVDAGTPGPDGPKPAGPKAASRKPSPKGGPVTPASRQPGGAPRPKRPAGGDTTRSETRRGGRRRFSLPPLDEDHERVTRSIETFLSGSDPVDAASASDDVADAPTVATTVALVAIHGLDTDASLADPDGVDDLIAAVERTLRGAARSADRVSAAGRGRFRVVLAATGELAARAYLRRVRATIGPSLEAVDAPLGLVTATATVLDDTVQVAVAQAEGRLDAALASAAREAADDESRVAPD
jgi:hypothetical protein